jgi:hypothetical protein
MTIKNCTLSIFFILASVIVYSQEESGRTWSFNFDNVPFMSAVSTIESKTGYVFYYRQKDVEAIIVNLDVKDVPVSALLDEIFKNSDIHYVIDPYKNIFVTRSTIIEPISEEIFKTEDGNDDLAKPSRSAPVDVHVARANSRGNKVYEIGNKDSYEPGRSVVLSGRVKNSEGSPVVGASVEVTKLKQGIATNAEGYYSITLPAGKHELLIRSVGMETTIRTIQLYANGILDIEMPIEVRNLTEVLVEADETSNVRSITLGVEKISISEIKNVPTVFGEADLLRVVMTLPGVKSVGEASTGFNVRGGAADQNLILFGNSTIYNPSHFFGFFSAFNSEMISDVELYKSTIPAKYGGRLSSVLQVTGKEGSSEKIKGSAGIGLMTGRFNIEGPINKGKTTFIGGIRTTYSNWILKLLPDESGYKNTRASFYDANVSVTHRFGNGDNISLTGYLSHDESNLNTDTLFSYNNRNISVGWHHQFNTKLSSDFTIGQDRYDYNNRFSRDSIAAYSLDFDLSQKVLRGNFIYSPNAQHLLEFGIQSVYYNIRPGDLQKLNVASQISPVNIQREQALESALYVEDQFRVSPKLSVTAGIRYSVFNYLGPQNIRTYDPKTPKTGTNAVDTLSYKKGEIINTMDGLDLRLSGRYGFTENFSLKVGYTTTRQFIHMLSNTIGISPTHIWKLTDPNIKPQYSQQISMGLYKNMFSNKLETSVEGYVKRIKNYLDYKSGAQLLANERIETEVFTTEGNAYGIEAMIRKPKGSFNGWLGYTYSRALLRVDDAQAGENINRGKYYPASYDKPHDFTLVANQKLSRRFSFSLNVTYSTGRPVTIPLGVFYYGDAQKTLYSDRNSYRVPDYFRTDLSFNIDGNHKIKQLTHNSWTIGVYNLTGRRNPYSIYFTSENGIVKGYKLSIFGAAIPFVNYNIRF